MASGAAVAVHSMQLATFSKWGIPEMVPKMEKVGRNELVVELFIVKMQVGTAHSDFNPTHSYFNSKGIWLTYLFITFGIHILVLSVPFFSVALAWTLTNVIHDTIMFVMLHITKGTPWETPDQGTSRSQTQWEQMDYGKQFTITKKFLTIVPIVLFFLASFYTKYDKTHFFINAVFLALSLIPKLPQFHGVRLFGINKY